MTLIGPFGPRGRWRATRTRRPDLIRVRIQSLYNSLPKTAASSKLLYFYLCTDLQILHQSCQINKVTLVVSSYKICHTTGCVAFICVFLTKVPNWISYLILNFTQPSNSPSRTKMYARSISMSASALQNVFTTESLLWPRSSNSISPNYTSRNFTPNNNLVSNS